MSAAIPDTDIMGTTTGPITIRLIATGDIVTGDIAIVPIAAAHMATGALGGADAAPETGAIAIATITAA